MNLLAITHHNGIRIAELGFLLGAAGGAALALTALAPSGARIAPSGARIGKFVAGVALAAGSVLLIIAAHWGHFG
jgi:hypothetical protein